MLTRHSLAARIHQTPRSQSATQSRVVVIVAAGDADLLRRMLFAKLKRHIQRIVVAIGHELGSRRTLATLHIVMDRETVGEALRVVMSTASSAQFGRVQHF